jgi:hypothetical protein
VSREADLAIAALEDYLARYPNGHFAEIAQARLDKLLALAGERKATAISPQGNPFSKGTVPADTEHRVGDWYDFEQSDLYGGPSKLEREQVVKVTTFEVHHGNGIVNDLLSNTIVNAHGRRLVDNQTYPAEYAVGKRWVTRYRVTLTPKYYGGAPPVEEDTFEMRYQIVARETIQVGAGRFEAFRLEGEGFMLQTGGRRRYTLWVAPDRVRRALLREYRRWDRNDVPLRSERYELVAYKETRTLDIPFSRTPGSARY